jgi:hypothetical protein
VAGESTSELTEVLVGSGDAWNAELTSTQWAIQRAAVGHDMVGAQPLAEELTRMFDPSTCDR